MKKNILFLFVIILIGCEANNSKVAMPISDSSQSCIFNNNLEIITNDEYIKFSFTEPYHDEVQYTYILYKLNGNCYASSQSRNFYPSKNGVTFEGNNDSLIKSYRKMIDCNYLDLMKKPLDSIVKLLHGRDNSNSVKHYKSRLTYKSGSNNFDFDYNNLSLTTMNYLDSLILSQPIFNDQLGAESYTRTNFRQR